MSRFGAIGIRVALNFALFLPSPASVDSPVGSVIKAMSNSTQLLSGAKGTPGKVLLRQRSATREDLDGNAVSLSTQLSDENSTSSKILLRQLTHLLPEGVRCCAGYFPGSWKGYKMEAGMPWTCNVPGCNCLTMNQWNNRRTDLDAFALCGKDFYKDYKAANKHKYLLYSEKSMLMSGPWKEMTASKICIKRSGEIKTQTDFYVRFRIVEWYTNREVIPWTDYSKMKSKVCIPKSRFEQVDWLNAGARLKIYLKAKDESWGTFKDTVKKKTHVFPGTLVYNPNSGTRHLGCFPNHGHIKHHHCKVYNCYSSAGGNEVCDELEHGF